MDYTLMRAHTSVVRGDNYIKQSLNYICVRWGVHVGYKKEELWLNHTTITDSHPPISSADLSSLLPPFFSLEVLLLSYPAMSSSTSFVWAGVF